MTGTDIPYSFLRDTPLLLLLTVIFLLIFMVAAAQGRALLARLALLFRAPRATHQWPLLLQRERWGLRLFAAATTFLYALFFFLYSLPVLPCGERWGWMVLFFVVVGGVFLLRHLLTLAVNKIFFADDDSQRYGEEYSVIMAVEGLLLLPMVYAVALCAVPCRYAVVYVAAVCAGCRLLALSRQRRIFFSAKDSVLGYFVYLCTLEIAPFVALWGVLTLISGTVQG